MTFFLMKVKNFLRIIAAVSFNRTLTKGDDMQERQLGANGPMVSALGLGCMAMSEFYGPSDDEASRKVILTALEKGVTHVGYGGSVRIRPQRGIDRQDA